MAAREWLQPSKYLSGLNEVVSNLNEELIKIDAGSIIGLNAACSKVLADAKQLAPIDTGALRNSGTVTNPIHGEDGVVVQQVGFYTRYAAEQHEHTEYAHPKGGECKYLEKAINLNRDTILELIANGIKL